MATPASRIVFDPVSGFDPTVALADDRLIRLFAVWREKAARAPGGLPDRRDIPLEVLHATGALPYTVLVDAVGGGAAFRLRLVGTRIVEMAGRDVTGRTFDEVYPAPLAFKFAEVHRWVTSQRRPARYTGSLYFHGKDYYAFEVLWLPLTDGGSEAAIHLGAMVFGPHGEPTLR